MTLIRRIVPTSFWSNIRVIEDYTSQDKLFMFYLLTNPSSSQLGIYSLPKRLISFHTGFSLDEIEDLLQRMEEVHDCIAYCKETQEVAIKNYLSYAIIKGGRPVIDLLTRELSRVQEIRLIEQTYLAMQDYWQRSRRPIDQAIYQLFKDELRCRGSQLLTQMPESDVAPITPEANSSQEAAADESSPRTIPVWQDWTLPIVNVANNNDASPRPNKQAELIERHQAVINHYETHLHQLASKDQHQLALLSEEHGASIVIKALDEARQAEFPLSYTRAVLSNWIHRGII